MADEHGLIKTTLQDLKRTGRSFACSDCGCNVVHPANSNFLLVFGTGTGLLVFNSIRYSVSPWRAVQALRAVYNWDSSYLSGHVDLGNARLPQTTEEAREVKNEMTEEDAIDLLENCADLYNVKPGAGDFEQYCPTCAAESDP